MTSRLLERTRALIIEAKATQSLQQIADRCGVPKQTIRNISEGRTDTCSVVTVETIYNELSGRRLDVA